MYLDRHSNSKTNWDLVSKSKKIDIFLTHNRPILFNMADLKLLNDEQKANLNKVRHLSFSSASFDT